MQLSTENLQTRPPEISSQKLSDPTDTKTIKPEQPKAGSDEKAEEISADSPDTTSEAPSDFTTEATSDFTIETTTDFTIETTSDATTEEKTGIDQEITLAPPSRQKDFHSLPPTEQIKEVIDSIPVICGTEGDQGKFTRMPPFSRSLLLPIMKESKDDVLFDVLSQNPDLLQRPPLVEFLKTEQKTVEENNPKLINWEPYTKALKLELRVINDWVLFKRSPQETQEQKTTSVFKFGYVSVFTNKTELIKALTRSKVVPNPMVLQIKNYSKTEILEELKNDYQFFVIQESDVVYIAAKYGDDLTQTKMIDLIFRLYAHDEKLLNQVLDQFIKDQQNFNNQQNLNKPRISEFTKLSNAFVASLDEDFVGTIRVVGQIARVSQARERTHESKDHKDQKTNPTKRSLLQKFDELRDELLRCKLKLRNRNARDLAKTEHKIIVTITEFAKSANLKLSEIMALHGKLKKMSFSKTNKDAVYRAITMGYVRSGPPLKKPQVRAKQSASKVVTVPQQTAEFKSNKQPSKHQTVIGHANKAPGFLSIRRLKPVSISNPTTENPRPNWQHYPVLRKQ